MRRRLTARQKEYQRFLATPLWKRLRAQCIERDKKCQKCGSTLILEAHHLFYRRRLSDTQVEDLVALCRKCHRQLHGFAPSDFRVQFKRVEKLIFDGAERGLTRIPKEEWIRLNQLVETVGDVESFGQLLFTYCRHMRGWNFAHASLMRHRYELVVRRLTDNDFEGKIVGVLGCLRDVTSGQIKSDSPPAINAGASECVKSLNEMDVARRNGQWSWGDVKPLSIA